MASTSGATDRATLTECSQLLGPCSSRSPRGPAGRAIEQLVFRLLPKVEDPFHIPAVVEEQLVGALGDFLETGKHCPAAARRLPPVPALEWIVRHVGQQCPRMPSQRVNGAATTTQILVTALQRDQCSAHASPRLEALVPSASRRSPTRSRRPLSPFTGALVFLMKMA